MAAAMRKDFLLGCAGASMLAFAIGSSACASSETVLHRFRPHIGPDAQLQEDNSGSLYGVTRHEYGTVYRLIQGQKKWRRHVIYNFTRFGGGNPLTGLTPDPATGGFYGTTSAWGSNSLGTVFALTPSGAGWRETVLHNFTRSDGALPLSILTRDNATGVLYGTAYIEGSAGCGTAFEVDPATSEFTVLHNFTGGNDCNPRTQLVQGPSGVLIGGTSGGNANFGNVYALTKTGDTWTETVLYNFHQSDGRGAEDLVVVDDVIYGVTESGGAYGEGVAFRLEQINDSWKYRVIHTFTGGADGGNPAGLLWDQATGFLYGTTSLGGSTGAGVLFRLSTSGREKVLHNFGRGRDAAFPSSRPIIDPRTGTIYGTTALNGRIKCGTVYEFIP
jgi:uncharacterized repeat protein (TIGR03803 family)